MQEKQKLAITFDMEWWGRAHLLPRVERHRGLDQDIAKVYDLVTLLDQHKSKATFFVVTEDFKGEVLETLLASGHEIASHTCSHPLFTDLDGAAWRKEMRESKATLEQATGASVVGFRTPSWSVPHSRHEEFLDLLMEEGYEYDSSFCQFETKLYGNKAYSTEPFMYKAQLIEIPLPRVGFPNWPWVGGFYFRVLPGVILNRFISRDRPAFLYFHPWEFYSQPDTPVLPPTDSFITHYGRERNERKLDKLLARLNKQFDFVTMKSIADQFRITSTQENGYSA
jgi:peptidoglycan/xylan/chitin deacetylase (PgdA/CDA1 family)